MAQALTENWWKETAEISDQMMEQQHAEEYWPSFLDHLGAIDFTSKNILDFGCNQGGLLRLVASKYPIAKGVGVDVAVKSVETANNRKGDWPLEYRAVTTLTDIAEYKATFDIALSTSVLYLVEDLKEMAEQLNYALKPGAVCFADFADYDYENSAFVRKLRDEINSKASIPYRSHTMDDIATAFSESGFKVNAKRVQPKGFTRINIPDKWCETVGNRLDFAYNRIILFQFSK